MIPDRDIPYFSTIAASAATLLGLSFFALIFFLTDLFRRFAGLALPIHRQELKSRVEIANRDQERSPEHVTDFALFDGDPLVVFSAFSVAVTWNAYFVSLVVSLTAVSHQLDEAWTFAVELVAFPAFLTFSLIVRNAQRRRLATYRTRDEHFWSVFEWGFVALCGMAEAVAVIGAATMGLRWRAWRHLSVGILDSVRNRYCGPAVARAQDRLSRRALSWPLCYEQRPVRLLQG